MKIPEKHYQLVSTGKNKYIPTDISTDTSKKYDCDYLYEELGDLVNDNFRAWYMSKFYKLGKDRVLQLASTARNDGINKSKLFSFLLSKS